MLLWSSAARSPLARVYPSRRMASVEQNGAQQTEWTERRGWQKTEALARTSWSAGAAALCVES